MKNWATKPQSENQQLAIPFFSGVLERDTNCDANTRVSPVVHVVPIVSVANVNVVRFVPVACPRVWPRINKAEPIAAVLKAWESADDHVGLAEDYELMA
jgi:hypothetical protein